MMGKRDPQKQLWSYRVNLDKRVRSDHPLRRINQALDLAFVRPEVARFYGTKGNVSEDPVVIVKMMLLLFLDNVRSERELMRIIPERLDYMWFLGYSLPPSRTTSTVKSESYAHTWPICWQAALAAAVATGSTLNQCSPTNHKAIPSFVRTAK